MDNSELIGLERSLVTSLIFSNQYFDEIFKVSLNKNDFLDTDYGELFELIQEFLINGKKIDHHLLMIAVKEKNIFLKKDIIDVISDYEYNINVLDYAKKIKEYSNLRLFKKQLESQLHEVNNFNGDFASLKAKIESIKLNSSGISNETLNLKESLKLWLTYKENTGKMKSNLISKYDVLDQYIKFKPSAMITVAARPGMGKSIFALNLLKNFAAQNISNIAFFCFEMDRNEVLDRLISLIVGEEFSFIRDGYALDLKNFPKKRHENITENISSIIKQGLYKKILINTSPAFSSIEILCSECRRIKRKIGLSAIVIDYLQLMGSTEKFYSKEQLVSHVSRQIKLLALELKIPIVCLAQLNRAVESTENKIPNLSHLRDSGGIEQDSDIVAMLYRENYYNNDCQKDDILEVHIKKNRSGQTGKVPLKINTFKMKIEDVKERPF